MIIKRLSLENFRNHKKTVLNFSKNITVLLGKNGAGKTSLLEAIFCFTILRPFRNFRKKVFIKDQEDFARAVVETNENKLEIFWQITPQEQTVFKKNLAILSTSEFLREKNFFAVLFSPENLTLPTAQPRERRRFLSQILSLVNEQYFFYALNFEKILKNRNRLLQKFALKKAKKEEFIFWDRELIKYSQFLTQKRAELIDFLKQDLEKNFQKISANQDQLKIDFKPSSQNLNDDLAANFDRDVLLGSTSKGAHRDDFCFYLRNKPLGQIASRGEMRSCILALKLTECAFLKAQSGKNPLLLFDDVFSELDQKHCQAFLKNLTNNQVIISTTEKELFFPKKNLQIIKVKNGSTSS